MSDRIEAAPDVRELVEKATEHKAAVRHAIESRNVAWVGMHAPAFVDRLTAALTTLSAKCAEQAAEIERLGAQVIDAESSWLRIASRERARAVHAEAENARLRQREAVLVSALELVRSIIKDGAEVGFNWQHGDWAERLYASQGDTHAALSSIRYGKQGEA